MAVFRINWRSHAKVEKETRMEDEEVERGNTNEYASFCNSAIENIRGTLYGT